MILHNAPEHAVEFMSRFTPEQIQEGMEAWDRWKTEADKTITFEYGMPLQPVASITPNSVAGINSLVSGYSIVEADTKEVVIDALRNHPHLERSGATLDIFEFVSPLI